MQQCTVRNKPRQRWVYHLFPGASKADSLQRVMLRTVPRQSALLILLAGLILRFAAPIGYMPASAASGLLFELCPDQLPAGFTLPGQSSAHKHHHHNEQNPSQIESDRCQIGHLLSATMLVDDLSSEDSRRLQAALASIRPSTANASTAVSAYRSRGPPA